MGEATINATRYLIYFVMKKLILKIDAVEDRTAPIMFSERNLPGACCCTCCCCCCSTQEAETIHETLETEIVKTMGELGGGGPAALDFTPYYEAGLYDFMSFGIDVSPSLYDDIWRGTCDEYMNKYY